MNIKVFRKLICAPKFNLPLFKSLFLGCIYSPQSGKYHNNICNGTPELGNKWYNLIHIQQKYRRDNAVFAFHFLFM